MRKAVGIVEAYLEQCKRHPVRWNLLSAVMAGTALHAELSTRQSNQLESFMQEIVSGRHDDLLKDRWFCMQLTLQLASWVNSAHTANCFPRCK